MVANWCSPVLFEIYVYVFRYLQFYKHYFFYSNVVFYDLVANFGILVESRYM